MKHSHLLPHLLEVVEQLQCDRKTLSDEAAALGSSSHKPDNTEPTRVSFHAWVS